MIVIIKGCGTNLASLQFACERLGKQTLVTDDQEQILAASHVILPGVGRAQHAMTALQQAGLATVIPRVSQPVLGICVGMQILHAYSQEDDVPCLGIFPNSVQALTKQTALPLPHMGWNRINLSAAGGGGLFTNIPDRSYLYYVHSYAVAETSHTIATTIYGQSFAAAVQQQNFFGVQFHPERSGQMGLTLLSNFFAM